ncbi:hypothetical protein L6164_021820 [Bauhinia variegata]|uniref:Uncharacterized protein n=1 Tax=Bauhinia variegata TaxID=167791 RepID=A0ACB9MEY8_BAUVA|nr:hypothetical protein L6164_021820 [Bauhinia variegata]
MLNKICLGRICFVKEKISQGHVIRVCFCIQFLKFRYWQGGQWQPTIMRLQLWIKNRQIFGMAEKEMEYRVELFNKLTHTCFNKCVDKKYKESELNMGENSCIDRCVSKYWHVTNLVGQLLGSGRPPM